MDVVLCVASRREVLNFFGTRLDCARVAQTHFLRIIAFRERVIMQARAPISTFSIFCVFQLFRGGDLDCAGVAQTHIPVKTRRFSVCWSRFFYKAARVIKIDEELDIYRSDFPELRSRLHNNTIRVVPACFFGSFGDAVLSHKARICRYLPLRFCISELSLA